MKCMAKKKFAEDTLNFGVPKYVGEYVRSQAEKRCATLSFIARELVIEAVEARKAANDMD